MANPIETYNLGTGNKWILSIPFKDIDENASVDNLTFNLTAFDLPELEIKPASMSVRGRNFSLPTGVKDENKFINVSYLLSSDWHQYRFLYKWYEKNTNAYHGTGDELDDSLIDIYVSILSEFKNKLFDIVFKGCWLSRLGRLTLNYQTGENNIEHSFGFYYQLLEFQQFDFET